MKLLDLIPEHESWRIIDSSKLTTYMTCPRKFFFRHILGWSSSIADNNLVFGSSWHLAAEHLLRSGYTEQSLKEAKFLFLFAYREKLDESTDELFEQKNPDNAARALDAYYLQFAENDSRNLTVLHTEVLAVGLIGPDMPLYGKLDALLFDAQKGMYICLDHKTSKYKFYNWRETWELSPQMQFYAHVLRCLYGDAPQQLRVRGSFFYKNAKKPFDFDEAIIEKSDSVLDSDITTLRYWYLSLLNDLETCIEEASTEDEHLYSFPKNTLNCFSYNRPCSYLNICQAWSNPVRNADEEPPMSMHVEFWDPRKQDRIKEAFDLTKGETS